MASLGRRKGDRVRHAELLHKLLNASGSILAFIQRDADDREALGAGVTRDLHQARQLFAARLAPGCPVVDEHDLAAMIRQPPFAAAKLRQRHVRQGLAVRRWSESSGLAPPMPASAAKKHGHGDE